MTYFKTSLVASTALTLSMGVAFADPNTLFLDQDGNDNTAFIQQDIPGFSGDDAGGNDFGTTGNHALQDGNRNEMKFTNGSKNYHSNLSAGDNDVLEAKQIGDDNRMYFSNNSFGSSGDTASSGNDVNSAIQSGNNNYTDIVRHNADDGEIDLVRQEGDKNFLRIVQEHGNGNSVGTAIQIGSNNGFNQYNNTRQGTYIAQGDGSDNRVDVASIDGSNNGSIADNPGIYIDQSGSNNGLNSSTAQIFGNYNQIKVLQTGDSNNFFVRQGTDLVSGNENLAELTQIGSTNDGSITQEGNNNNVYATQIGNGNFMDAQQIGNANLITATFIGDGNGDNSGLSMTGMAGTLEASSGLLTQGTMFQNSSSAPSSGNTISYIVEGSNNLFAFAQIGAANTITGTVGTTGASNGNQVAVLQDGSSNSTTFTQNGGGNNNLAVSQ